jgi:hypothetical protein
VSIKTIVKYVGIIYKLRHKLPLVCLKNICFAYIHSHIIYGVEVYGVEVYGAASASRLDTLVKLNNKILQILQYKDNRSHIGELFKTFGTLPVCDFNELQIATFVHKVFHHS